MQILTDLGNHKLQRVFFFPLDTLGKMKERAKKDEVKMCLRRSDALLPASFNDLPRRLPCEYPQLEDEEATSDEM